MKSILSILFALSLQLPLLANDGAFFASGNHLIPIAETDISVKKEILTVKKVRDKYVEVTVYYEFFNPKEDKEILVGFEAFSPSGDVNGTPENGLHPYMRDFTVNLNNQILRYDVAYVSDKKDYQNGKINSQTLENVQKGIDNENNVSFYYVYHFKAKFKKGLNIIKHTYNYDISGSISYHYAFDYILTAANRWANKQIDDFTLIVDMGEFETFNINKSFFANPNEWIINGIGKSSSLKGDENSSIPQDAVKFVVQKGNLIFQKQNFKPAGELVLYAVNYFLSGEETTSLDNIPFSYYQQGSIAEPKSELSRKILKNLPFARRGYIFTTKEIQQYYENLDWYIPNPNYKSDVESLTEMEKEWIRKWQ